MCLVGVFVPVVQSVQWRALLVCLKEEVAYSFPRDVCKGVTEMRKLIVRVCAVIFIICAVLLLASYFGVNADSCWDAQPDFIDCKVKAEQGDARAQFNLGRMYHKGDGVPQDYVMAHMFYNLAAWNGYEGKAKEFRDTIARLLLTPYQIAEAQRLAREWMEEHQ